MHRFRGGQNHPLTTSLMSHLIINLARLRFKALGAEVCMKFKKPPVLLSCVFTPLA